MSTPPLFFIDHLPLVDVVLLTGDEGHHAANVMRMRPGQSAQVSDGHGALLSCTVRHIRPDGIVLAVDERVDLPAPLPRLTVVQALPKGDRGELAVATMTELGVDAIVAWQASRCVTRWDGARADKGVQKWGRTAREASKQSRRARIPVVGPLMSTADVALLLRQASGLVLHEAADEPLAGCDLGAPAEVVLVVGPEGGISAAELTAFAAAGARPVRMGPQVLRTSTAGPAALAVLSQRLGRWS